nr:reverse transcriptase domain-containing protein [Tanacetum cinerariifolium]
MYSESKSSSMKQKCSIRSKKQSTSTPENFYPSIPNINYFCHFLDILRNYDPMDDEPMWAADHVVALTPGSTITIPETTNEFAIKDNHLTLFKGNQFNGRTKTDPHKHIHEFLGICDMFKCRDTKNEKQLNLGVGTERLTFNVNFAIKHSYSNDDTYFSIDEILKEDVDALLDERSEILHSIKGTCLEEEIFFEFDAFKSTTVDENSESEPDNEEPSFEKITINIDYKIKTSLEEPHMDLKLKPLLDNLEYVFLKEPFFSL